MDSVELSPVEVTRLPTVPARTRETRSRIAQVLTNVPKFSHAQAGTPTAVFVFDTNVTPVISIPLSAALHMS